MRESEQEHALEKDRMRGEREREGGGRESERARGKFQFVCNVV